MPDKLILLVREVERLVTAPYAPSLQDLHNIVQHTSSTVISSWASCKLCQVGALVDVLVDGLSRSRVALPLLRAFAPVPAFRNALLERYPAVLDNFLEKAVENEEPEHFSACIALLSSPLPPDFIAPARLAPFVMKLIVKMGERPCAETMLPLYRLMTGLQTSPRTLYDVPFEILSSLQMELTKTLRNLDDHMGNLLCLATFARIASSQQINSEKEHGPDSLYWKLNINHLFGPRRGAKILDLVVKRVVFACSSGCSGFTSNEVAESVRLAIEICDSVEPEQKQTWIAASSSKVTIAKLFEKVTRDGIDHGVQMMGVTFLASLLPPAFLSQEILALGLQGLLSDDSKHVLEVIPCELIPRLVEANVIYSGELIISKLFDYVFSALKVKSSSSSGSIATVQVASSITFALQRLQSQQWASVILEVARSQYAERIGELLETFPEQSCQSRCESSNICHAAMSMHEKKLLVNFIGLYSGALLQHNAEDDVPDPIESRILTFFMNQVKTNLAQNKCSFSTSKPFDFRGSFSSLQIREDSSDSYQRRDWRTGIADTLMLNARASHKNMMKKVEEVCQDLEDRCYDTETPLRIVVEEREQLSVKTEQLKNRNQELETQTQHASITIANLQQTIAQLEHHAEISSAQFEELSATLEAARSELEEQRHNSQETTQSEREKARTRELGLIATMAEKDQHLEELQDEIREQREENDETRRILDTVSKEKAACLEESVLLKQEISRLEQSTEANRLISAQKDDEIQQLLADKESSIMEIKALQQRVRIFGAKYP
ncbi:hypothetical protein ASPWEDRAFT_562642 [Aspergillus wentii DTO 134E9]|uniref:Uncharacterized protein n=1 Tax=Aspergillus wentii DTO 134E9 TaxID=1073089 RepID=A0A1L9RGW0_ASPWE|nr:uncharacterized protein ASPWEDRAFT_562642 [Aspergillus wentii DTO 134E9]OJJ34162.1 hypothetical protein ASPWEDRAFT_562642 [Aspergillus wentii DTO 134E9]